ncbi:MAG: four helix bundle protein [Candidatus Marinimicrobia bacterium]|nr:four helix bundle protein [Candidatus Neomarinimicrobiota bacterium]
MKLEELKVYQESMEISELIWQIVIDWNYFARDTIGKQLVRAIDSVSANISEGFGRYHYKENKNFCYYSRGSLYESKTWIIKAFNRDLISKKSSDSLLRSLDKIGVKLNNYIKSIGRSNKQ